MDYKVNLQNFEGPLDLLLHLIKKSDVDICDIKIEEIAKQYLDYITAMEELNLTVASEYLIMAAELIEIKSSMLLPKPQLEEDEYEEDPRERLIKRLIEYKQYKEMTKEFKTLEEERKMIYTKEPSDLSDIKHVEDINLGDLEISDLIDAFNKFLERSFQIKNILKKKKKVNFEELFEEFNKDYIIVTFLSILSLAKKQELNIYQDNNFSNIVVSLRGSE